MYDAFDDEIDHEEAIQTLGDRLEDLARKVPGLSPDAQRREIHSLKGLAACYGYSVLAGLAHELESELATGCSAGRIGDYLESMAESLLSGRPCDMRYLDELLADLMQTA